MFGLFKKKLDVDAFIAGSVEGLRLATAAHSGTWHFGEEKTWDVDQDNGKIVFSFEDGTIASAPVQIVGTFNANDNTFMWGWDHPSVIPALQINASRVRDFGKEHAVTYLTTQKVSCSEQEVWKYSALAMRLSEATGAYRGEAGPGTFVFMNFGEVTLAKRT